MHMGASPSSSRQARAHLLRAARRSAGCAASAAAAAARAAGGSHVRDRRARPAGCRKSSRPTSASWYVRGIIASACAAARAPQPEAHLHTWPSCNLVVRGRHGCQHVCITASACAAARAPQLEACLSFILPDMSVRGRRGCQLGVTQEIKRRAGESLVIYAHSEPLAPRGTPLPAPHLDVRSARRAASRKSSTECAAPAHACPAW